MKQFFSLSLVIALALLALPVAAQQDITSKLSPATLVAATTNTAVANGVAWLWAPDAIVVLSAAITGAGVSETNAVTVSLDTSSNGTDWSLDRYTLTFTPTAATATVAITRLTNSVGAQFIRFGTSKNSNLGTVTLSRVSILPK